MPPTGTQCGGSYSVESHWLTGLLHSYCQVLLRTLFCYSLLPIKYSLCSTINHHQHQHHCSQWPCMVQAAVQSNSQQAAQQQKRGRQSAFAHAAVDLNEDDEYLKQQQPQVTPAEARNQYRRPARLAGRLAQLQRPPRAVEVRC